MKTCRWSAPVLVAPSVSSELTFSMNGAVTLAPVAGETIDSVGVLLPALEPEEPEEPPDPEEPLEAEGVLVPHAAMVSSAAAPVANTNVRWDRICVLLQRIYWALVVDTSGCLVWFKRAGLPGSPRPTLSESGTRRTPRCRQSRGRVSVPTGGCRGGWPGG